MSDAWVGFDLDGTLAHYEGWDDGKIGAPISLMVERWKRHRASGLECRIFTARAVAFGGQFPVGSGVCPPQTVIEEWAQEHLGEMPRITCQKDRHMILLYDDRAIQVEKNTGRILEMGEYTRGDVSMLRSWAKYADVLKDHAGFPTDGAPYLLSLADRIEAGLVSS